MGNRVVYQRTTSIASAREHTHELVDPTDRCNADAVLNTLRIQDDNPYGARVISVAMRHAVLAYMRNHGIAVNAEHAHPHDVSLRVGIVAL